MQIGCQQSETVIHYNLELTIDNGELTIMVWALPTISNSRLGRHIHSAFSI